MHSVTRLGLGLTLLPLLALAPGCMKGGDSAGPEDRALGTRFAEAEQAPARSDRGASGAAPSGAFEPVTSAAGEGESYDGFEADEIAADVSPGLGTSYGETRSSSVESVGFRRADPSTPDVVFSIRYDDVGGVGSAARTKRTRAFRDDAMHEQNGLTFALLDARGDVLPAAAVGADLWAVGEPDERYSLAIANDTGSAFEVVASVDGLDIIDGRPASFAKRGYIVDPFSSVVIDGWRTSEDTVAAFRFSSIEDSYAERMGDGRNIGVIGAAFFREAPRTWDEWRPPEETWRRDRADPFPGR